MLVQVIDRVVDVSQLVDQVIRDLVEVTESIHIVVTGGSKLKNARVARKSYRVDGREHILSRDSGLGQLLLCCVLHLLDKGHAVADHASNVRFTDLGVRRGVAKTGIHETISKGEAVTEYAVDLGGYSSTDAGASQSSHRGSGGVVRHEILLSGRD